MKRYNIYIPEELLKKLQAKSESTGIQLASLIRNALIESVKEKDEK